MTLKHKQAKWMAGKTLQITPKKIYSIAPCHHFPAENRMARKKNLEFKTERKRKHRT